MVAAIASIEIPRNEWTDLIPNLCINCEHVEYNIRMSSLTTLEFTIQDLNITDIDDATKNRLILAVTNNITCDGTP